MNEHYEIDRYVCNGNQTIYQSTRYFNSIIYRLLALLPINRKKSGNKWYTQLKLCTLHEKKNMLIWQTEREKNQQRQKPSNLRAARMHITNETCTICNMWVSVSNAKKKSLVNLLDSSCVCVCMCACVCRVFWWVLKMSNISHQNRWHYWVFCVEPFVAIAVIFLFSPSSTALIIDKSLECDLDLTLFRREMLGFSFVSRPRTA